RDLELCRHPRAAAVDQGEPRDREQVERARHGHAGADDLAIPGNAGSLAHGQVELAGDGRRVGPGRLPTPEEDGREERAVQDSPTAFSSHMQTPLWEWIKKGGR